MDFINQYQQQGLTKPISIKPTLKMHALLWGGGAFLLAGCGVALLSEELKTQLIGLGGGLFFGFAIIICVSALLRSHSRGLVEFSQDGLWLSTLGVTLPWHSLGPAWVNVTKHDGGKTKDVVFIVKDIDRYITNLSFIPRIHLRLLKRTLDIGKGGSIDLGLEALFHFLDEKSAFKKLTHQLEYARDQAQSNPSVILLNIPVPFRLGINPQSLVAIINVEVSKQTMDID
ncbi:hypothetical protein [uncultured Shewanella sp.]|uniref:hypothetical protein n=1 Tax=uncultured Shewanella sp. TaxID=173975 RepID=UPI0026090A85|nr:hypothetical protein [uncultured Shewanella sp.]